MEYVSCFLLAFRDAKKYQYDMFQTHVECWHNNKQQEQQKKMAKNIPKAEFCEKFGHFWPNLAHSKLDFPVLITRTSFGPILPGGFGRGVSQLPRNPRVSPAARRGNQH